VLHVLGPHKAEWCRSTGADRGNAFDAALRWIRMSTVGEPSPERRPVDRWGIATSLLSISSPGTHFGNDAAARTLSRHVNDTGAEIRRAHPDRFGQFASLPLPDVDGALLELAYALDELGAEGVTVETNAGGVYLGDTRHAPLWAEIDRRRTPVFMHPTSPRHAADIALGRPRPMLEFIFDTTRAVSDLLFTATLERYPDIPWIIPHGGGTLPLLAERMELFRSAFDTCGDEIGPVPAQLARLWFDIAGTPFPHQVPALASAFGTEHILYGSDFCWTPPTAVDAQLAAIDNALQPPDESWRALTTRNAQRLFEPSRRRSF
jgi:6-methylsalicylate decarboxylase